MTDLLELSTPAVTVGGQTLPQTWLDALISLRVERGLCLVSRAVLRFSDPGYALSGTSLFGLGTEVAISVQGGAALHSGLVTGASLEQTASAHPELIVTVDDAGCKLGLGTRVQTFLQASFTDVLNQIVGRASLRADVSGVAGMQKSNDYLLQRSSDLAFLDEMARRSGSVWWVEDNTLKVRAAGAGQGNVQVTLGEQLSDFSVRASGLRPTAVSVRGWDAKAQQDVVGKNLAAPQTAVSGFVAGYLNDKPSSPLGTSEQTAGESNPNNVDEADALASALHSDWHAGAVVARGSGLVNASIAPLTSLAVGGAGPASGTYVVSSVEHVYRRDGFYTRFVAGPIRPSTLVDTLGPVPPDPGFAIPGLLTAKVSNVKDPDGVGRVKVSYAGAGGTVDSAWARVVALGGGSGRGTVFHPEVGDEVLVGFERGDSRHPVVIGGLYSAKVKMPADSKLLDASNKVSYRRITSRLGHVIELADGTAPADQHILLSLSGGQHLVRVGADKLEIQTSAGKPISITSGPAKFEIDASGNIAIEGNRISIKAKTDVAVEGVNVAVKAQGQAQLQGAVVDVKAQGAANVTGSAALALKGAIVKIN